MTTRSPRPGALAAQARSLDVPPGQLAVWALGQHGFLLKGGDHVVVIDPYLSDYITELSPSVQRRVPIPVAPGELDMVDTVLITHHHGDHCDPRTMLPLLEAASRARVYASYTARDTLQREEIGEGRVHLARVDEPIAPDATLRVTPIPAAHYTFEPDEHGNPAYLGFVIELNGVTLYHSGDTIMFDGLIERLQDIPIDVACLPINGRDWFREHSNLTGNLDYREAAELAVRIGGPVMLATHNDMFYGNRINPSYLFDYIETYHPEQRVHLLRSGELYYYVKESAS